MTSRGALKTKVLNAIDNSVVTMIMTSMLSNAEQERLAAAARLVRTIRTGFRHLAQAADRLHADAGDTPVTAAMRVVLEMLDDDGPMTVPQMARQKGLSRQHFQTKVDALADRGLVEAQPNPAHARSVLIAMTAEGQAVFAAMKMREAEALLKATASMQAADLGAAIETIQKFTEAVGRTTGGEMKENDDDGP